MSAKVRLKDETRSLVRKAKAASITCLKRAGAYIRGMARKSIKVSPERSAPGKPPRSRKGRLKRAIVYAANKEAQKVIIGPSASEVGKVGRTHEFGGTEPPKTDKPRKANWKLEVGGHGPVKMNGAKPVVAKLRTKRQVDRAKQIAATLPQSMGGSARNKRRKYPPRPFMGPALERSKARLPKLWANSIKGG